MEEQGGEARESKYPRLEYGGSRNPNRAGMEEPVIYQGIQLGRETDVPPEGYDYMYHRMQTETGEKLLPITIAGIPIKLPKPDYFDIKEPGPFPGIPPEILKYLFPDYDPSDPHLEGLKARNPPCPPKPLVFLNEAHKKRVLASIQRQADLKRRQEEALENYDRDYAAYLSGIR